MQHCREAGFFMWETLLSGLFLLLMAGSIGLYARAITLKSAAAEQNTAIFLARAQIAYAQSRLDTEGKLPAEFMYLGDEQDLLKDNIHYQVTSKVSDLGGIYQLQVIVSWEVQGRAKQAEFSRMLGKHGLKGTAGDGAYGSGSFYPTVGLADHDCRNHILLGGKDVSGAVSGCGTGAGSADGLSTAYG